MTFILTHPIISTIMSLLFMGQLYGGYLVFKGGNLNTKCVDANGGLMPVYRPKHRILSKQHFPFYNKTEVEHFDLCDIHYKEKADNKGWYYYSKGDKIIQIGRNIMLTFMGINIFIGMLIIVGILI